MTKPAGRVEPLAEPEPRRRPSSWGPLVLLVFAIGAAEGLTALGVYALIQWIAG